MPQVDLRKCPTFKLGFGNSQNGSQMGAFLFKDLVFSSTAFVVKRLYGGNHE
jgi:hypothetical protein